MNVKVQAVVGLRKVSFVLPLAVICEVSVADCRSLCLRVVDSHLKHPKVHRRCRLIDSLTRSLTLGCDLHHFWSEYNTPPSRLQELSVILGH